VWKYGNASDLPNYTNGIHDQ